MEGDPLDLGDAAGRFEPVVSMRVGAGAEAVGGDGVGHGLDGSARAVHARSGRSGRSRAGS